MKEVLKLALEALEFNQARWQGKDEAITAIKEALAQQALDRKAENARELGLDYEPENTLHWHALNYRTAPTQNAQAMFEALERFVAQPEQEPVAWEGGEGWESLAWELCADENGEDSCNELIWEGGPIPEPWGDRWMKYEEEAKRLIALVQKHTTPPQRKPLTDEEIYDMYNEPRSDAEMIAFARAIEAAHGIKE